MARQRFAKLGPFPVHGAPGARFLREGKYNKRTGRGGARWLIYGRKPAGTVVKDSRGRRYTVAADGSIRRAA